jgi:hypothetical protein
MKSPNLTLTFIISLAAFAPLRADAPPPLAPELKELERTVGTWKVVESVAKVAEWTPKEVRQSGEVATTKLILGGRYAEDRNENHLGVWSYDEAEKVFHYSWFPGAGGHSEFTFRWDAAKQSFIGGAPLFNGIAFHGEIHFPDAKTKKWHLKATDAAGKVYLDLSATETRTDK